MKVVSTASTSGISSKTLTYPRRAQAGATPRLSLLNCETPENCLVYDITFVLYVDGRLAAQNRWSLPLLPKEDLLSDWWEVREELPATAITLAAFIRDANSNGLRIRPDGRHEAAEPQDWPPSDA